jgi:peptide/nickel transport system permease protein
MLQYIVRRAIRAAVVIVAVLAVVFLILNLTGDPARLMVRQDATEQEVQEMRVAMGFDQPLPIRFVRFMGGALQGDFGKSLRFREEPAIKLVMERFPATLQLAGVTFVWSVSAALVLGLVSAVKRYSWIDNLATLLALVGQSMPNFWLGIMLILFFAVSLRWLPAYGSGGPEHLILPALTLGAFIVARNTRLIRSTMIEVLSQDYIRTGRAKGLSERGVVVRHALKNAAIPVVTLVGLDVGALLGGAVVTETVFAWPGVGRLAIESINSRDFPVVSAVVFFVASGFVLINLLVDMLYTWLDPRIRLAG